jgi:hypothetical protein
MLARIAITQLHPLVLIPASFLKIFFPERCFGGVCIALVDELLQRTLVLQLPAVLVTPFMFQLLDSLLHTTATVSNIVIKNFNSPQQRHRAIWYTEIPQNICK